VLHSACEGARTPILAQGTVVADLTRREREVALLLARGQSDREIAATLSISPATAGTHVHNVLAKLDLRSRHQVAAWAVAQGIATPPGE
jgi:DNA-binding CsgD family transcriptional regulator